MRYQLFQYALPAPPELADLNAFLASERIASVQHHIVTTAAGAQLVFVVQVQPSGRPGPSKKSEPAVDYKTLLTPEQFATFAKLREERKRIAEAEGVPVYTIFSNAQLAEMVQRPAASSADLLAIEGVGSARVERYGERMLALLASKA